ncbi:hypothetical protein [Bacillus wiedmannii]|uniref:Uncharacterized protein n=1 Tax=Bacillus wiedmannii TaxID=1890302 RepID=A0A2A8BHA0_9BACI|nr:hypothetical protein [Bacillus wiedmannii]PEM48338.1 hypothetical protein CN611_25845 [Bacillus wiedmannii]PGA94790.1 hypothetical protein COL92_24060 [Bacillus wiedmannii]
MVSLQQFDYNHPIIEIIAIIITRDAHHPFLVDKAGIEIHSDITVTPSNTIGACAQGREFGDILIKDCISMEDYLKPEVLNQYLQ